jgi:hypothetical protein
VGCSASGRRRRIRGRRRRRRRRRRRNILKGHRQKKNKSIPPRINPTRIPLGYPPVCERVLNLQFGNNCVAYQIGILTSQKATIYS